MPGLKWLRLPAFAICCLFVLNLTGCNNGGDISGVAPNVRTRSGLVSGVLDGGVYAYLGIPYAAPPVGELRWQVTQRETAWNGLRAADSFSPACPQDLSEGFYDITECNEDCLYLNVWTPEIRPARPMPVMFWIHGGAFVNGSASESYYNARALAAKGVVVVSINYRLGPLGFMVHRELYNLHGQTGNYGHYDQMAALQWVRDCISDFGGDPDNVTIFGISSGASSVTTLQTSGAARGMFHKAIAQSGMGASNYYAANVTGSWNEAARNGDALQAALGSADITAMRAVPADTVIAAAKAAHLGFGTVMDGIFMDDGPRQETLRPLQAPMIIGTNRDEGSIWMAEEIETVAEYQAWAGAVFGGNAPTVLGAYPAPTDADVFGVAGHVFTMAGFNEPARLTAQNGAQTNSVYRYYFTYQPPTTLGTWLGAFHGAEIPYVMGNLDPAEGYGPQDFLLSEHMMDLWISFARNGIPQADGVPDWPNYSAGAENILQINGPDDYVLINGLSNDECDFFAPLAPVVVRDYP